MADGWYLRILEALCERHGWDFHAPVKDLPPEALQFVLYVPRGEQVVIGYRHERGENTYNATYEGLAVNLERRYRETESEFMKNELERYMVEQPCPTCGGKRLRPEALGVSVDGRSIWEISTLSVSDAYRWAMEACRYASQSASRRLRGWSSRSSRPDSAFSSTSGSTTSRLIARARRSPVARRKVHRLATQIGSSLMGVLYILDEPSIGLHQRDNAKLIATLTRLRDLGNTLIVVEHDEGRSGPPTGSSTSGRGPASTVARSLPPDRSRPSSARRGPSPARSSEASGRSPSPRHAAPATGARSWCGCARAQPQGDHRRVPARPVRGRHRRLRARQEHARHGDSVPRGRAAATGSREAPGAHDGVDGIGLIDKVIGIDQSPIGRTPRSNPATYTGLFGPIRELFAGVPEARVRGYGPGRFSFNVKGGRCENCKGDGIRRIEMQFLPDVYVPCEVCKGRRYNREALEIHFKGRSIADVLDMTIEEALEFFHAVPKVAGRPADAQRGGARVRAPRPAGHHAVGRGGPAGEARHRALPARDREDALRPRRAHHRSPLRGRGEACQVLHRLVDAGNTVVVIEHNLDVIKTADWIVDLGPEGGHRGGRVIAEGTPEAVAVTGGSATGEYLARVLRGEPLVPLSDVTFADEAGRTGTRLARPSAGRPAGEAVGTVAARKRAAASSRQ